MKITCGIYLYSGIISKFLLCHASRTKAGNWSIPKGLADEGESCLDAAFRELEEETGVNKGAINITKALELPPVKYKKQNKTLVSFLICTDTDLSDFKFHCSSLVNNSYPEVDKYRWAGFDEMRDLAHESQQVNLPLIASLL